MMRKIGGGRLPCDSESSRDNQEQNQSSYLREELSHTANDWLPLYAVLEVRRSIPDPVSRWLMSLCRVDNFQSIYGHAAHAKFKETTCKR